MKLYLPSWNGDFRLERSDEGSSVLQVESPTAAEQEVLSAFVFQAVERKWLKSVPFDWSKPVEVGAPVHVAGPLLIRTARPTRTTLTAVRSVKGEIEVVEGVGPEVADVLDKAARDEGDAKGSGQAVAASVKRPTPCCPRCIPGSVGPAREVLLSFLSLTQHHDWARSRAIVVEGGLSGHHYVLAHRHTPFARANRFICFDVEDDLPLHFHDWTVPPEEEVLAAALILAHREPWLRNEATALGGGRRRREKFKNPFGEGDDGIADATWTAEFGATLRLIGESA